MFSLYPFAVAIEDLEAAEAGSDLPQSEAKRILSVIEGDLTDLI